MAIYDFSKEKQEYTDAFYQLLLSLLSSSGGNLDLSAPRLTLIGTVKLKIDELQAQQEGVQFISTDSEDISNTLDLYINGLLDECAKHILQTAPIHVIIPTNGDDVTVVEVGDTGYVLLKDDYLRFVSFKMNTWLQEVTEPITIDNPKYKLQKYSPTRGGIAKPVCVLNSVKITNTPQKQIDTLTLSGTEGKASISCAGISREAQFDTSPTVTAANFVTNHAADYLALGVVVTSIDEDIIFTAQTAGTGFTSPFIVTTEGDLTGSVVHTQENVPATEGKRTLEYYSVQAGEAHVVTKFLYIANVGAEYIQENLTDALTWLCASKVLQIMGDITNQGGYAEKALENVKLSYQNLM